MDICIHLTQSIHSAWHANPPFVKDPKHMLSINTSLLVAWRARMLEMQSQVFGRKMTAHLKKRYVLRIGRWSLEFDRVKMIFLLVEIQSSEDIFVSDYWGPFHPDQERNKLPHLDEGKSS